MLEDEIKLILAAKQGESASFDKLYSHYLPPIYRFIYMKVSHREEAEDLTHEVFLSAWLNIPHYEPQGFPFSSWLYQIARNRVIDHYRTKKPQTSLDDGSVDAELIKTVSRLDEKLDDSLDLEIIRQAIKKLTHDQQDVLLMRFMEDLSHQEIAAAINKSAGAVRLIQHRALNELKKNLSKHGR